MTAYTARSYPYPQPADAANGPANIQALASAVDSDVTGAMYHLGVSTMGDFNCVLGVGALVGIAWPSANQMRAVAFRVRNTITPTKFVWYCTVASGNVDGAIVNGTTWARMWSKGSTACPAAGTITWAVAGVTLVPGTTYYMCFNADNTTVAMRAVNMGTADIGTTYAGGVGAGYQNAAFPIPNPIALAATGTYVPLITLRA